MDVHLIKLIRLFFFLRNQVKDVHLQIHHLVDLPQLDLKRKTVKIEICSYKIEVFLKYVLCISKNSVPIKMKFWTKIHVEV